jgi:hypothetical protein
MNALRIRDRLPAWLGGPEGGRFAAAAILAGALALGAILADDFGESWDERGTARLGRAALRSYETGEATVPGGDLARHGPVVSAAVEWGVDRVETPATGWTESQARHFLLYLFYVAGLACVYGLARRWVGAGPAAAVVALMGSQPVLFGHAFINPNDGPFLTLFSATVLSGFWLGDVMAGRTAPEETKTTASRAAWSDLRADWARAAPVHRRWLALWALIFAILALELLALQKAVLPVLRGWVYAAYTGQAWGPINDLFRRVAEDASAAPVEAYYGRLWLYYSGLRWVVLAVLTLPGVWLVRKTLPSLAAGSWARTGLARALVCGVLLGLASAVRLIAPLAGLFVSIVVIARARRRSFGVLAIVWATAILVMYLAWPALWGSPIEAYRQYLNNTFFVPFDARVLFEGRVWLLEVERVPWYYLPTFPVLQTTLPALALFGLGVWAALTRQTRPGVRSEILTVGLWACLPMAAAIGLGSTTYDNARHFLFIQPALYLFAALGLQQVWPRARRNWARGVLVLAALLPAILAILRLHPYEYVYFNELAGGVRGAFRRYELDYWALSYREAAEYLDREASQETVVAVVDPVHVFQSYARHDLQVYPVEAAGPPEGVTPEFVVMTTRSNQDLDIFPDAPIVFQVEVGGAILTVVKKVP